MAVTNDHEIVGRVGFIGHEEIAHALVIAQGEAGDHQRKFFEKIDRVIAEAAGCSASHIWPGAVALGRRYFGFCGRAARFGKFLFIGHAAEDVAKSGAHRIALLAFPIEANLLDRFERGVTGQFVGEFFSPFAETLAEVFLHGGFALRGSPRWHEAGRQP